MLGVSGFNQPHLPSFLAHLESTSTGLVLCSPLALKDPSFLATFSKIALSNFFLLPLQTYSSSIHIALDRYLLLLSIRHTDIPLHCLSFLIIQQYSLVDGISLLPLTYPSFKLP